MVPAETEKDQPTLEEVQELFAVWRNQKGRRDPIPPALWEQAVHLAAQYSINTIAKHLRLNYNEMKIQAEVYPVTPLFKKRSPRLHRTCQHPYRRVHHRDGKTVSFRQACVKIEKQKIPGSPSQMRHKLSELSIC